MKYKTLAYGPVTLYVTMLSATSLATSEPPPMYDGRSTAMGSTAVAHVHNAAAIYHNVAAMHEVEQFTVTANIAPVRPVLTAPLAPGLTLDSESDIFPLYLVGGTYRLSKRVVVGLASYAIGGFGGTYEFSGMKSSVSMAALEVSPAVAFALTENLSLGVGYRAAWMTQDVDVPQPAVDTEQSGFGFLGAQVGAYYRANDRLRLGLVYRSKIVAELEGTTKTDTPAGPMEFDSESEFAFPHAIRAGVAFDVIPDDLLLAVDLRYLMHKEANKEIVTTIAGNEASQPLDWEDSFSVGLGAEYFVTEMLPVRAGYVLLRSATPEERPQPFFAPPGLAHSIHAGAGIELDQLDIDVGGMYSVAGTDVESPEPPALPGSYESKTLGLSFSVTYRN